MHGARIRYHDSRSQRDQAHLTIPAKSADLKDNSHQLIAQLILFCASNMQITHRTPTTTPDPVFYAVSDLINVISVFSDPCSVLYPEEHAAYPALAFPCWHLEGQEPSQKDPHHQI